MWHVSRRSEQNHDVRRILLRVSTSDKKIKTNILVLRSAPSKSSRSASPPLDHAVCLLQSELNLQKSLDGCPQELDQIQNCFNYTREFELLYTQPLKDTKQQECKQMMVYDDFKLWQSDPGQGEKLLSRE